jgi:hypothetical protein
MSGTHRSAALSPNTMPWLACLGGAVHVPPSFLPLPPDRTSPSGACPSAVAAGSSPQSAAWPIPLFPTLDVAHQCQRHHRVLEPSSSGHHRPHCRSLQSHSAVRSSRHRPCSSGESRYCDFDQFSPNRAPSSSCADLNHRLALLAIDEARSSPPGCCHQHRAMCAVQRQASPCR